MEIEEMFAQVFGDYRASTRVTGGDALVRQYGEVQLSKAMGLYLAALRHHNEGGTVIFRDKAGKEKIWKPKL